jgi:hypothetical protein
MKLNGYDIINESFFERFFSSKDTSPQVYYMSQEELNNRMVIPTIPDDAYAKLKVVDLTIQRIPFYPDVKHCIMGTDYNVINDNPKVWKVYKPFRHQKLHLIDNKGVVSRKLSPVAHITKEVWITSQCKMTYVGSIKILERAFRPSYSFVAITDEPSQEDQEFNIYEWSYKVLDGDIK